MAPALRIQEAAASILAGGHTLRLVVDGRRRDVLVPRRIRAEHGAKLIIDIGEQQRRTVSMSDEALEVELAFAAAGAWCRFPWVAVTVSSTRAPGAGSRCPSTPRPRSWARSSPPSSPSCVRSAAPTGATGAPW